MRESIPNPCPKCGSTNIKQHWCNPDDHGLIIEHYYQCENCGRTAGFCDQAGALERWNSLKPEERIEQLELENKRLKERLHEN